MDRLLPPPEGEAVLLFRDRRGSFATDLRSGLGRITQSGSGCVFARLEYLDRTMTWQAGESRFGVASPQLALLAERFDATYCAELLRDTATSTVGASANALVSRASYVGDRLPAGSLFPEPPPSHFRA
jgi:hypothetical protein